MDKSLPTTGIRSVSSRWINQVANAAISLRVHWASTLFGVVSVAAAVAGFSATLTISDAMTESLGKRFEYLGRDTVAVSMTDRDGQGVSMSERSYRALARAKGVFAAAPIIEMPGTFSRVSHGEATIVTRAIATTSDYFRINLLPLHVGRGLTASDDLRPTRACVIGYRLASRLGLGADPRGSFIRLGDASLRVVGVLNETMESGKFASLDYIVITSVQTAQSLGIDTGQIDKLLVAPMVGFDKDIGRELKIGAATTAQLHAEANGSGLRIESRDQLIQASREATQKQGFVVSLIAALSLVVSGFGIMNVAYLGVAERVQEIGLRRAVGASTRMIRNLFLTEALLISVFGDFIGLFVAWFSARPIASLFDVHVANALDPVKLGLVSALAVAITVVFCLAPARRASAMDPIVALRAD